MRLPNGKLATREYLDHPGAVAALPLLGDDVILVEQYRHPIRRSTLEIPAGKLDPGEKPLACIKRELREETGYVAKKLTKLVSYWPTAAFSNEVIHVWIAEGLKPGPNQPDEDEFLRVVRLPVKEALRMARDGRIQDSKTLIALFALEALRR